MAAEQYTYHVRWSHVDQEYVATVAEFPSLSWLDPDRQIALDGIRKMVAEVDAELAGSGSDG
ncbi:antitoxin HicB [Brevibacterium casei]|uniref:antitoxin HicB n=1 Tax=Brevibacterium casei TaxID=33889 RepID=UPI00167D9EAD|nr:antitoxin HicB [Brevibacterium casei]